MTWAEFRGDEPPVRPLPSARASSPSDGPVRVGRATVLSVAALGLAVGAHAGAGGSLPSGSALVLLATAVLAVGLGATTIRWRFTTLFAGLGLSQVALHLCLAWLATSPTAGSLVGSTRVHHHGSVAVASAGPAGHGAHVSLEMVVAHVGALVATSWLLARGEEALRAAAARFWPDLPAPVLDPILFSGRPSTLVSRFVGGPARRVASARGPPSTPTRFVVRPAVMAVGAVL